MFKSIKEHKLPFKGSDPKDLDWKALDADPKNLNVLVFTTSLILLNNIFL